MWPDTSHCSRLFVTGAPGPTTDLKQESSPRRTLIPNSALTSSTVSLVWTTQPGQSSLWILGWTLRWTQYDHYCFIIWSDELWFILSSHLLQHNLKWKYSRALYPLKLYDHQLNPLNNSWLSYKWFWLQKNYNGGGLSGFRKTTALKVTHPHLKVSSQKYFSIKNNLSWPRVKDVYKIS